jgi:hypothetical protein
MGNLSHNLSGPNPYRPGMVIGIAFPRSVTRFSELDQFTALRIALTSSGLSSLSDYLPDGRHGKQEDIGLY